MQLLGGDVVEQLVVLALLDAAERVHAALLQLDLEVERPDARNIPINIHGPNSEEICEEAASEVLSARQIT